MTDKFTYRLRLKHTGELGNHFNRDSDISQFARKRINEEYVGFLQGIGVC
jgi:hypothetical protein